MALEPAGELERGRRLRLHPELERLEALQQDPGVEGRERGAGRAQERGHRIADERFRAGDRAAHHAALAVDVFGRRMNHEIRTELKRALQDRRAEHVVDRKQRACLIRDRGERRDVGDLGHRVRRCLEEEKPRVRPHGAAPFLGLRRRNECGLDAEPAEDVVEELDRRAEHRVRADDVIAAFQVHERGGEDCRHARGGGDARLRAFERREAILEHRHGGIGVARVHHPFFAREARRRLGGVVEHEARREIERFGVLLELAAHLAGAHAQRGQLVVFGHKKPGPLVQRTGFFPTARFSWIYYAPASCGPSNRREQRIYQAARFKSSCALSSSVESRLASRCCSMAVR